jgi:hypothetical protein
MLKKCSKCLEEKMASEFNNQKSGRDGKCAHCKACAQKLYKEYREKNLQNELKRANAYKAKNKDKMLNYYKKYRQKNPHIKAQNQAKRRANLSKSPLSFFYKKEINEIYELAKRKSLSFGEDFHVDHIYPLKGKDFCGLHVPWNLEILKAKENMSKGNKLPNLPSINFDWLKNAI